MLSSAKSDGGIIKKQKMPRVTDIISLPNVPIGLTLTSGRQVTYSDLNKFLKRSPPSLQKLTNLTTGGIILTIVGALATLFSKAENVLSSLLLIAGLGVTATGFALSPCYKAEPNGDDTTKDKADTTIDARKAAGEIDKERAPRGNTSTTQNTNGNEESTIDELISILLNRVKGKKYTAKDRVLAAIELGKRKAQEAVIPLVTCLKDKFKSVVEASITALGKIGGNEAFHALRKFLKDDTLPKAIKIKATNAMKEIAKSQTGLVS